MNNDFFRQTPYNPSYIPQESTTPPISGGNNENIDVSSIAKLFGGGGHEEAAGLTIPYINANVYSLNHFFNIIECAGRLTPGQFDSQSYDMSDTNWKYTLLYIGGV